MKIPVNLASQPFRRDRAMLLSSIGVCFLLVSTLGVLIFLVMADRTQLADVRHDVSQLETQIRKLTAEQVQMDTVLRRPENAEVLELSVFLNGLLSRKSISWTRIFADLEKTVPHNVKVVQVRPLVTPQEQVSLDLTVASESPVPLFKLIEALQNAPFSRPEMHLMQQPTQAEPIYKYRVSVQYAQQL